MPLGRIAVFFPEMHMPGFTVFRAKRSDLDKLRLARQLAHRLAEDAGVGLTYFVPAITQLKNSDLADIMAEGELTDLVKRRLKLSTGQTVGVVSAVARRYETGVVLALWTAPERMRDLESCVLAKEVVVVTNDEDELDEWLEDMDAKVF